MVFWVYSEFKDAEGRATRGYRVFNLYQRSKDPKRSDLVEESPAQFFQGATVPRAGVIIPDRRLQGKLLAVVAGGAFAKVRTTNYSLLSNPDNDRYQNCTEHVLNVLFAALYNTSDMAELKANISAYFQPHPIALSPLVRAFGPVFSKGVRLDDQTQGVKVATFSSIARFMQRHDLAERIYDHRLRG